MEESTQGATESSARFPWQLTDVKNDGVVEHGMRDSLMAAVRNEQAKGGNAEYALRMSDAAIGVGGDASLGRSINMVAGLNLHTLVLALDAVG